MNHVLCIILVVAALSTSVEIPQASIWTHIIQCAQSCESAASCEFPRVSVCARGTSSGCLPPNLNSNFAQIANYAHICAIASCAGFSRWGVGTEDGHSMINGYWAMTGQLTEVSTSITTTREREARKTSYQVSLELKHHIPIQPLIRQQDPSNPWISETEGNSIASELKIKVALTMFVGLCMCFLLSAWPITHRRIWIPERRRIIQEEECHRDQCLEKRRIILERDCPRARCYMSVSPLNTDSEDPDHDNESDLIRLFTPDCIPKPAFAKCDTGTIPNWISRKTLQRLNIEMHSCSNCTTAQTFRTATGQTIQVQGSAKISWTGNSETTRESEFLVVDSLPVDVILGSRFCFGEGVFVKYPSVLTLLVNKDGRKKGKKAKEKTAKKKGEHEQQCIEDHQTRDIDPVTGQPYSTEHSEASNSYYADPSDQSTSRHRPATDQQGGTL